MQPTELERGRTRPRVGLAGEDAASGDDAGGAWSARRIASAVRRRELSPVEVVEQALGQIDRLDPGCNAFVEVHREQAHAEALALERAVMRGRAEGPLLGVPVAIKDLSDSRRGWRHTRGSHAFADRVAPRDSLGVERLLAAGATVVGTTNTAELGHKCLTDNRLNGATSTPFLLGHNAGGSSGGSAAAVAAGMVAAATGSDGAGSLRVPASFCGVFTLKPTFGSVPTRSRPNGFGAAWPMTQTGILTRSVADAALVMDVLAAPARCDPLCASTTLHAPRRRGIEGLRIGYCADWGGFPIAAEVAAALAPIVGDLERMGARVEPVERVHPFAAEQLGAIVRRAVGLMLADVVASQVSAEAREQLDPGVHELIGGVERLSAIELRRDEHTRTELFDCLQEQLLRHDVLAGPAVGATGICNAADGTTIGPSEIAGRAVDPLLAWCPAYLLNLTGHPAVCLPAGSTPAGVPVGLQLVGERYEDANLMAIAEAIERDRPWAESYARL